MEDQNEVLLVGPKTKKNKRKSPPEWDRINLALATGVNPNNNKIYSIVLEANLFTFHVSEVAVNHYHTIHSLATEKVSEILFLHLQPCLVYTTSHLFLLFSRLEDWKSNYVA